MMMFGSCLRKAAVPVWMVLTLCALPPAAEAYLNNAIISWGDNTFVYGPETDSALDTPEGIERLLERLKGRDYTGIYLRTDLAQFDPAQLVYHPVGMDSYLALQLKRSVDDVTESFDVAAIAQQAAQDVGFEYWAYHPHIYSDGAPADLGWSYHMKHLDEHPEELTVDRNGTRQYMVWEYAYPGARAAKVQEFVYMAQTFGIKHFIPDMRTEAAQLPSQYYLPAKADQFGFNQIIVDEMLGTYGVDIMTDPRFDVFSPSFNVNDPMVENWRVLRGHYLTQLFREIRLALNAVDPDIRITARIPGDRVGPELGNWIIDWRTWVDEGLVDVLVVPTSLAAGIYYNPAGRDFLPTYVPIFTYRDYIDQSSHPQIKIIQAGGWEYFPTSPPPGADGWQTFWTCEAFDVAWYQRWQQWQRDLRDFGYIKFFAQDFDGFSLDTIVAIGAEGDARYRPDVRACPGAWLPLGDGTDNYATVQQGIRHGSTGQALKITRDATINNSIKVRHMGGIDRTTFQTCVDNIITNGRYTFEFWLYRYNAASSIAPFLQYSRNGEYQLGLYIQTGLNGPISYWNGSTWAATGYSVPTAQWQKLTMDVDLETQTYSGYMGANNQITLFTDVPYSVAYNRFDQMFFSTAWPESNVTYIDDVMVKWYPNLHYAPPAAYTYLADDFESHAVDATIHGAAPHLGPNWTVFPSATANGFSVENDLSFGDGVKSLAATRNSNAVVYCSTAEKLPLEPDYRVTIDFDVLFKEDYAAAVSLKKELGGVPTAAIYGAMGKWYYWNGSTYADSGVAFNDFTGCYYWHHVQMALDCGQRTYTLVVQPVGSLPTVVGTYPWDPGSQAEDSVFLEIAPQGSNGQKTYFDNIRVTYGPPCSAADLTEDCKITMSDFAAFAQNWLEAATAGDFYPDGTIDVNDLKIFMEHWLENAAPPQ